VLTTATTMDIFRITFTGFEEQFDYSKKCMWKKMERKNWTTMLQKKIWWLRSSQWDDTMCWMTHHSSWRYIYIYIYIYIILEMMTVCVNSLARAKLPLEKVVAMA
jgi:hypothetical protein